MLNWLNYWLTRPIVTEDTFKKEEVVVEKPFTFEERLRMYSDRVRQAKLDIAPELEKAKKKDEEEKLASRSYIAPVQSHNYPVGRFISYTWRERTWEWPVKFIESIKVKDFGIGPRIYDTSHFGPYSTVVRVNIGVMPACSAMLTIRSTSGKEEDIYCNRHTYDMLHEALVNAWKGIGNYSSCHG